jgi:hypothetical protein
MPSPKRAPGARVVRMTVAQAIRCASMDCEASKPTAAMLVWVGEDGRVHKQVFPNTQVLEDGLFAALQRLPPGSTKPGGCALV